ncbi:exosome nuclease subunit [Coemansia sp. RSA 1804]|nr:exosome nuclease subunit [Coemansia sp. RSA 1804]
MSASSSSSNDCFAETFDATVAAAYAALLKATRAANRLPSDIKFHRTVDEALDRKLEASERKTLAMANTLWSRSARSGGGGGGEEALVESVDDVAARSGGDGGAWAAGPGFGAAVDAVDALLERIDAGIDEIERRPAHALRASAAAAGDGGVGAQSAAVVAAVADAAGRRTRVALVHAKNIPRPQLGFRDAVDNARGTPFVPRLRAKPHALVPLREPDGAAEHGAPHPYAHEIAAMQQPPRHFAPAAPTLPGDWDGTPFAMVDSEPQLRDMLAHLRGAREIAVDLEHHSYRSFQGFTCLVQISTRARDYVVDALALRHALHALNDVTADPRITKVLHGAESDVQWLQRDFGVYVVGLFDTYHAARVLNMPHHSLAHLLRVFCAYDADKKYQLADWRLRPLPAEMVRYARADTHFLLYVYDRLRNELAARGAECLGQDADNPAAPAFGRLAGVGVVEAPTQPMALVLRRSAQTALRTYAKDAYGADGPAGWAALLRKWRRPLNRAQTAVFRALHDWRDRCARAEDESARYVLPNHMLFAAAERMPADAAALLAACRPAPPPLVRQHAADIARILARARADAAELEADARPQAAPLPPLPRPVHTRFNDDDGGGEAMLVDDARPPVLDDDSAVAGLLAPAAALFGPSLGAPDESAAASIASHKARAIRAHLVLATAAPASVHSFSPPAASSAPAAAAAAAAPASPALPSPKRPLVISDAYGRQSLGERKPRDAGSAGSAAAKRQRVGDLVDISKIALNDDDDGDGNSDGGEAPATNTSSASGGAHQRKSRRKRPARLDPADVSAFDYHAGAQPSDAIGPSNRSSSSRSKDKAPPRGKKRAPGATASNDSAAFNPYAAGAGVSAHAPKKRTKPGAKTGNRSMTFRK